MGIAVSTPSTQKVSAPRGGPEHGPLPPLVPSWGSRRPGGWAQGRRPGTEGWRSRVGGRPGRRGLTDGASSRQPLVFGAMVHRDEAFETIFSQYLKITAAAASGSDS